MEPQSSGVVGEVSSHRSGNDAKAFSDFLKLCVSRFLWDFSEMRQLASRLGRGR